VIRTVKFFTTVVTVFLIILGAAYSFALVMPGRSHVGALPALVEDERRLAQALRAHVEAIASKPHNTMHPDALEASARYIEQRLQAFGYAPQAQRFVAAGVDVRNIEVVIESTAKPVATLIVGAHYDSADDAPGANDNGSGAAALLALAEALRARAPTSTRLRLVFFVNEEPPHFQTETMGSLVYARALADTGVNVKAMLSLETIGYYSDQPGSQKYPRPFGNLLPDTGDFIAVVGTSGVRALVADVMRRFRASTAFPSVGVVAPGIIPGVDWSDHWSFVKFGIPAVMITDTAVFRYPHYHLVTDTPDKLDYERLARVTAGLTRVVLGMAE
jgi:Peptidase family M28